MISYIEEVLAELQKSLPNLENVKIILPSKRAGGFMKNYLRQNTLKTQFLPVIASIEEFIEEISGLKIIDPTELLFTSYEAYLDIPSIPNKDNFETYTNWAQTLLGDFNEIDRYLIKDKEFFSYLSNIKDLEHWYVKEEKTELIKDYLAFWESLQDFYDLLKTRLYKKNSGYQGMVYREASENTSNYISSNKLIYHVFIGFNALNIAEQKIFQAFLSTGNAEVFWDIDETLFNNKDHSASYFLRKYSSEWSHYHSNTPKLISNYYSAPKKIEIIEAQTNSAQVKYVGQLLKEASQDQIDNTAIIVADENLLIPLISSLPENVEKVNITMGVPIKNFPAVAFFDLLLTIQQSQQSQLYYKDVLGILNHPIAKNLLPNVAQLVSALISNNSAYLPLSSLINLSKNKDSEILNLLFIPVKNHSNAALKNCIAIVTVLKENTASGKIEDLVLLKLHSIFKKIEELSNSFGYIKTVRTVQVLFREMIASTTLDFEGNAYNGLQIMGVLESRVLDFKNIIVTSVNEGILPSGKSNASFITYDLKSQFGLPRYTEKDAIYTYHFYHLLQRSQNITLLHTNHSDGLSAGEKSRFIMQLEIEEQPNHTITHTVLAPTISFENSILQSVEKTFEVMQRLEEIASKGLSPSAITSYIRNPIDFYYQKIINIPQPEEVEETVAANTLGTIAHGALEVLYTPFINTFLSVPNLKKCIDNIDTVVTDEFKKIFREGNFSTGKNLIIFEVVKRYVLNFIQFEIKSLNDGNQIKIIALEKTLERTIDIKAISFPIKIKGIIDRIDEFNGHTRIIDYKSGKVDTPELSLKDWTEITTDYKFSKIVQVLTYSFLLDSEKPITAGIISFKNMAKGFLQFEEKSLKSTEITKETLENFEVELQKIILEIFDSKIPFIEKEIQ